MPKRRVIRVMRVIMVIWVIRVIRVIRVGVHALVDFVHHAKRAVRDL